MTKEIKFTTGTVSVGRNGLIQTSGLEIAKHYHDLIAISPLTSKGLVGRCSIEIPIESIPELIQLLSTFK